MSLITAAARRVQAMLQEEPLFGVTWLRAIQPRTAALKPTISPTCSLLTLAVVQSGVAMLVGFGLTWSGQATDASLPRLPAGYIPSGTLRGLRWRHDDAARVRS